MIRRAPFLLPSGLLAMLLLLVTGIMLSAEIWPPGMGWTLFLLSLLSLFLVLLPRKLDPEDPAGASFAAFGSTMLVALLLYNATSGAMRAERDFEGYAVLSIPSDLQVIVLRPVDGDRSYAFLSDELRNELSGLAGAELGVRLRVTRRFGNIRRVELSEVADHSVSLRAIGLIEHRPNGVDKRVRLRTPRITQPTD
ncbi:MAG: hypothetical protein O3A20_04110 [Planctomycetota bacterium]|nr:hypothetical protein [Planctomycetota bacterium]